LIKLNSYKYWDFMKVTECIFFQLASSSRAGIQYWNKRVEKYNLTGVQATIINSLSEDNGITFQQLAERLHLSNATLTGIVDRLEKIGLAERLPNPDDRRSTKISLTEKGSGLTAELKELMMTANQRFLTALSREEEAMLRGLLKRLTG